MFDLGSALRELSQGEGKTHFLKSKCIFLILCWNKIWNKIGISQTKFYYVLEKERKGKKIKVSTV